MMEETGKMMCAFKIDVGISVGKLRGKFPKLFLNLKNMMSSSRTGNDVVKMNAKTRRRILLMKKDT